MLFVHINIRNPKTNGHQPQNNFFRFKNLENFIFGFLNGQKMTEIDQNWHELTKNDHKNPFKWSLGAIQKGFKQFRAF